MNLQDFMDANNKLMSKERSNYHLTYGDLIDVLKAANSKAVFDKRVNGIGSYRGYYTDIALFTDSPGFTTTDMEYDWEAGYDSQINKSYSSPEHKLGGDLPTNANQLGALLESLLGRYFTGWKGGDFEIARDKPLWLETEEGTCSGEAVMAIGKNLELITKKVDDDE